MRAALFAAFFFQAAAGARPCDPIRTFADSKRPSREIFVSPAGSDTTGAGTRANPYQSIQRALQGIGPGEAVRLLPGDYSGGHFAANLAGTSNAPIWLGGVPGMPRPVFRGGSQALHLSKVRYFVVENLEVTGATANGINCDDGGDYANPGAARHVVFRNLSFREIGRGGNQDGLKLSGVNDFFVLDCEFEQISAGGSGIDHVGCHRGIIARCTFADMGSNSIQCKGGSDDIEIRANRFLNGGARAVNAGGSTGFEFFRPPLSRSQPNFEARNIRVVSNFFLGSDTPIAFVGAVECLAAHNTIVEPRRWLMRILQETVSSGGYAFLPSQENQFANNIVYFKRNQIRTDVNIGPNTQPGSFRFANNLWFASDQPNQSRPSLPAAEVSGLYGSNPRFRDAANGDYALASGSPAVAKGRPLPGVKADLPGNCYAAAPTLGAWEANPPPSAPSDSDGDQLPDDWEEAHGLNPGDPNDAGLDADQDGLSNGEEYIAGTHPNDSQSVLAIRSPRFSSSVFSFACPTVTGRVYRVQCRSLASFEAWVDAGVWQGNGGEVRFRIESPDTVGKIFRIHLGLAP